MIGRLRGIVGYIDDDSLILDVSGVGYVVSCSTFVLSKMICGEQIELWIHTQVKETEITLYGFNTIEERCCFEALMIVQGIGGKLALTILNFLSPSALADAIAMEDLGAFKAISGIGAKIAARIINELKNNQFLIAYRSLHSRSQNKVSRVNGAVSTEAVSALVNLGFNRQSSANAVQNILAKYDKQEITLEDLIKESLSIIS